MVGRRERSGRRMRSTNGGNVKIISHRMPADRKDRRKAKLQDLALIARLDHGTKSTSCQTERNFSAFALLMSFLRTTVPPFTVERMTFLRLNQG